MRHPDRRAFLAKMAAAAATVAVAPLFTADVVASDPTIGISIRFVKQWTPDILPIDEFTARYITPLFTQVSEA